MGILDGIVEWIAEQVMAGLDLVTTSVLGALGCDMAVFLRYFPAAETMYSVFVALAIGIILLNWVWQLFKNFGLGAGVEAEDPVKLSIRSVIFILLTLFSDEIVNIVLTIGGSQPSEIQVAQFLGFYDQIWGLWLMKANFLGMYFLVFYNIFKGIPKEYEEAAKIDGAGNFAILGRVMLPLIRNTFLVVMLIRFIEFWNDYQTPLIYLKHYPTVALGMFNMANTRENGLSTVPMRMTGAMLMLLPILAIFLVFQKKLVGNLTVGGIKG